MRYLLLLFLVGCSSQAIMPLNPPNGDEAIVHVIRANQALARVLPMRIYVDDAKAASLAANSYTSFSLPAGERHIEGNIKTYNPSDETHVLRGGEEYYFVYQAVPADARFEGHAYTVVEQRVSAAQGQRLMAEMD